MSIMEEHPQVTALNISRQRLCDLLQIRGDADDSSSLITTCRTLVETIDEVMSLLKPSSHENSSEFAKTYDSFIANNRDAGLESDLANMLDELQREATNAIMFLEDVDATIGSTYTFLANDTAGQHGLLVSQKSEHDKLLAKKQELEATAGDDKVQLKRLDNDIALCSRDVERLEEQAGRSAECLRKLPSVSASDICSDSTFELTSQRISSASHLISALQASPLKVIDEGSDYIVYEYTLGGSRNTVRVRDSGSGGLSFHLEPSNPKAEKYLMEHLRDCKSRIQITAILQESLSLP